MSNRWAIIGAAILVTIMIVASIVATLKIDLTPKPEKGKRPIRAQELAEGVRVTRHGLYGIDLVSIGKVHMRKLRKGPFTIGAINELMLHNVSLTLPEELWRGEDEVKVKGEQKADNSSAQPSTSNLHPERGPRAMLSKLGINAGNLKMGGKMPRFSALQVFNLRVARLEGTNAVPWFVAAHGEAKREGLMLEDGWSVENGKTNAWREAVLLVEPKLQLIPRGRK